MTETLPIQVSNRKTETPDASTVGGLIEILKSFNPETPICVSDSDGEEFLIDEVTSSGDLSKVFIGFDNGTED